MGKIREHVRGERFSLSFSGMGEPLLHPLVFKFIRHVSDYAVTSFSSNGSALTKQNVAKLIEAGLDTVYLSFNGDEPALFGKMTGGLSFDRVLNNLRSALILCRGSRLKVAANISLTKVNRHRTAQIKELLISEGVETVLFSMCHSRGGNLTDPEIIDTPALPKEITHCAVIANTLFIDWRGMAFICDQDIHGEHTLGDLASEPLDVVLARRQRLIDEGVSFKICNECRDVMKMGTDDGLRQWVYGAFGQDLGQISPSLNARMKWIFDLYKRENPEHYIECFLSKIIERERTALAQSELRENRVRELEAERRTTRSYWTWPIVRIEAKIKKWISTQ
jgi:hypothetical protein